MAYKLSNHPLYYKKHEKTMQSNTYQSTANGEIRIDDNVNNYVNLQIFKLFANHEYMKKFITNKIVVDVGSGIGKNFPLLSFFKPKKIISVEKEFHFIEEQKLFSQCIFPFLPKKTIQQPIEIFNETIEFWITRGINFDTMIFFELWQHVKFDEILKDSNSDIIIFTRKGLSVDIFEHLENVNYNVVDIIESEKIKNNEKNYFFVFCKKNINTYS